MEDAKIVEVGERGALIKTSAECVTRIVTDAETQVVIGPETIVIKGKAAIEQKC